jgi:hypothetical protein
MAFIGRGFDFNGDGQTDAIIGMNMSRQVEKRANYCGKPFPHEARESFSKHLELPNAPCVILQCGFCKQDSVAYSQCPWCGAENTWRHKWNSQLTDGWLWCCRCENQLGDNPCPRCSRENAIRNFHLLEFLTEEDLKLKKTGSKQALGCAYAALLALFVVTPLILAGFGVLQYFALIPGPADPGIRIARIVLFWMLAGGWLIPAVFAISALFRTPKDHPQQPVVRQKALQAMGTDPRGVTLPEKPMAGDQFWIRTPDGKQSGPHTKEQLARAASAGRIPQGTVAADSPNGPWKQVQLRKQT